MRSSLPTVVSDVGGAGEAVRDGVTGFLLPKDDDGRLYACLSLLAHQPWIRRQMGKAAHEHFKQNFTFDRMFDQTLRVYEDVLARRN
jgi:glycosyltransferase involved in cell wall biosynthesis